MTRYVLDIETDNLLDDVTKIHCIVLRDVDTQEVLTFHGDTLKMCRPVMENADQLIGHNLIAYDLPVLLKLWGWQYEGDVLDTLVCSRTVWPNLMELDKKSKRLPSKLWGSHSLKAWGYRLGDHKGDFNDGSVDVWDTFSQEMLDYCVQDTQVTQTLLERIEAKNFSADALDMEHKIADEMFKQEQRGFVFDVKAAESLFSELAQRKQDIEDQLQSTFEPTIVELKTKTKVIPFNPASRMQIADRLMKRGWKPEDHTPSGEPKVDEKVLESIEMPEAALLSEYLMLNKRLGQLATGKQAWLKVQRNEKLHGRVNHMGAVTSRCTHSNPNVAQVPSISAPYGKTCRSLFTVPRDYHLLGADASGLELRCLAHYMANYDSGAYGREILEGDIHTANQLAAGLAERSQAKTFIYGYLYGAGDAKVGAIIGKGAKEGKRIKKKFLDKTPALKKLRDAVNKAAERGWIKGLDGRRIPVRHAHAALNTLLQSAGAIICKRWYLEIVKAFELNGYTEEDVAIVAFVHDEVQIQVRNGLEETVGELVKKAMFDTERYYNFRCPLDSDYSVGANWADTH
jgi:DNA polymerase I-like protein with 3'-5' exonuclease and polymerase domains